LVVRGDADDESDVDVLVELDPERRLGLYDYASIACSSKTLWAGEPDLADRKYLHRYCHDTGARAARSPRVVLS